MGGQDKAHLGYNLNKFMSSRHEKNQKIDLDVKKFFPMDNIKL